MKKTAIVTIDIQMDYFPGGRFPLFRARSALRKAAKVLAAGRNLGLPIYHIKHEGLNPKGSFLVQGTGGVELHPGLGLPAGGRERIFVKHEPDSFQGTGLEEALRAVGVERLVWMGMMSWMCVDTTVRSAFARGFEGLLVEDACAAGPLRHGGLPILPWTSHRAFMAALGARFARLVKAKDAETFLSE